MLLPFVQGALTGAGFGVVLYKVGATRYSRVMGMLTLRDTKVMKFAFTTIGVASLLYGLAAAAGVAEAWGLVPRVMPFLGSAHLLGGALFGVGMGVSGLCPGTCFAKVGGRGGEKKFAAPAAMAGLVAGVLAYAALKDALMGAGVIAQNQKPLTLYGVLGLPYGALALGWGALFLAIAVGADRFTPEKVYQPARERRGIVDAVRGEWSWAASGIAAGVLVVLATAQGGYLGFSGAILAFTGWGAQLLGQPLALVPRIDADIAWRAALIVGVLPGAFLAKAFSIPSRAAAVEPRPRKVLDLSAIVRSFLAAAVMCLGALIGGGCTTGAFIAAWPTLSLGSLAMGGTFFVVSMAVSNARLLLLRSYDLSQAQLAGDRVYD
ncbi:MAG TPA: YeeE/YedE thiosulfate transporter family protein [Anaeromyxobacteraceae bacterium]|nr:YeeE/YedE thiosulfate transporter family protein [Anaeromyxobacteraceae bacterium]